MSATEPIFAEPHRHALATFALSNVLVAFDYDGTLAPIVNRPEDAHMRPQTQALLEEVARVYPTVVISGRALADISALVRSVPLWYIYGNHGLEPPQPVDDGAAPDTNAWVARLAPLLPAHLGVRIEDKRHSLTLHFRGAPDRERAIMAIDDAVRTISGVTVLRGNENVNLLPAGRGLKGAALTRACETFACQHAIYVGDEETDESAFAAGVDHHTLAIRVEPSAHSCARYHLGSQRDIDRLLRMLLDLRRRRPRVP